MYVSLSIEIDFMNVMNGYCLKVHFIKLIKFLLLILIKHVFPKEINFQIVLVQKFTFLP
jgi:hypothetical protein